jgi:hypothetical protein
MTARTAATGTTRRRVRLHDLDAYVGLPGGAVLAWCLCGFPLLAAKGEHERSLRAVWRAHRDHEGFTHAAGMAADTVG